MDSVRVETFGWGQDRQAEDLNVLTKVKVYVDPWAVLDFYSRYDDVYTTYDPQSLHHKKKKKRFLIDETQYCIGNLLIVILNTGSLF